MRIKHLLKKNILRYRNIVMVGISIGMSVSMIFYLHENARNRELNELIYRKNQLLNTSLKSDSAYFYSTKEYAETIREYTSDSILSVDGVSVSNQELIDVIYNLQKECDNLSTALRLSEASLKYFKLKYKLESKIISVSRDSIIITSHEFNQVDSAMLLLPYYRDKIKNDPNDKNRWFIEYEKIITE